MPSWLRQKPVAYVWAECAAYGTGDEEVGTSSSPLLSSLPQTAFTPVPVWRRVAGMKQILLMIAVTIGQSVLAADKEKVFSGPQKGEKATPFEVRSLTAKGPGEKRDPIKAAAGRPVALVFLHGLERSMMPLMRVVDQYGVDQKAELNTEFIFLIDDPIRGDQRLPRVINSIKTRARVGYSVDGIEGPGNYGLNKECLMTIVLAKEGNVTANFALVQPGIADAPGIIASMARLAGDNNPPAPDALLARQNPNNSRRPMRRPLNLDRLDLSTEAARQQAIEKLIAEVKYLRQQQATTRRPNLRPNTRPNAGGPKKPLPGCSADRSTNGGHASSIYPKDQY